MCLDVEMLYPDGMDKAGWALALRFGGSSDEES